MGRKAAPSAGISPVVGGGLERHSPGKAGKLLAKGDMKPQELDELTKIITVMDRLCSQGWDIRAAALEVMERFSEFLRGWVKGPEELKRISAGMQEFFRKLEDGDEAK